MEVITITRALIIGRFQPIHLGHIRVIEDILKENDELVICIGSAQLNYLDKHPFTAGERVYMIHAALTETNIDLGRCYIIPIIDEINNAQWVSHLKATCPPFDRVYTVNPLVFVLLKDAGVEVRTHKIYKRYSGTKIRERIRTGKPWKTYVPASVAKIIIELDGIARMQQIQKIESSSEIKDQLYIEREK